MTLRMTLTRPDLRAGESDMYGWQQNVRTGRGQHGRGASSSAQGGATFWQMSPKSSLERQLTAVDRDVAGAEEENNGKTLKRIWNRVRRS
jgi:hypothetical protein